MILLATRIYHPKTNWKETLPWISSLDIETITSWGKVRLMVQKSGNHHFIWQIYVNIPEFTGFYTSQVQVVQDFFHQQYDWICKKYVPKTTKPQKVCFTRKRELILHPSAPSKYATTRSTAKAQEPSGLFRVQIDKWMRERKIETGRMDRQIRLYRLSWIRLD